MSCQVTKRQQEWGLGAYYSVESAGLEAYMLYGSGGMAFWKSEHDGEVR